MSEVIFTHVPNVTLFRAVSGSQTVYFTSEESGPIGISNKVAVGERFSPGSLVITGSDVLWAWNGQDTVQFEEQYSFIASATSASLTVENDELAPTGKVLVFTGTGAGQIVWLTTSSLNTNRYLIEYYTSGVNDGYAGVAFLCENTGSNFHGFGYVETDFGTGWNLKVENGNVDASANTTGGSSMPNFVRLEVLGVQRPTTGSGMPHFTAWADSYNRAGSIPCQRMTDQLAGSSNWSTLVYSSSWDDLTLKRFGLALRNGTNQVFKIYSMIVRKHPLDR